MPRHVDELPPVLPSTATAPGSVDLWCFFYESVGEAELLDAYDAMMTPAERVRHRRFVFEKDRRLFLATRALVRTALGHYAAVRPDAWRFAEADHGKPFLVGPPSLPPIHFNLSNTQGLVVCAVSLWHEGLGVDAEFMGRTGETVSIANHFFSALETEALLALPEQRQDERFFSYWTLKESYIKARGLGLALPLDQFSFLLDAGDGIRIRFDPRLSDEPSRWRFELLRASANHLIAVGVDTGGLPLSLRAVRYIPLRGIVPFERGTP